MPKQPYLFAVLSLFHLCIFPAEMSASNLLNAHIYRVSGGRWSSSPYPTPCKGFRSPMETCSSLLCPSAANLTAPSATPVLQQNRKWASPYSWRTDHTQTTICSGYCRVESKWLACKSSPSIIRPQIRIQSLHRMGKSFRLAKKPFPEKAYYEACKRSLHWFKLGVNNKYGELQHWLPATHLGEPGWTEQTHIQDKLCRLDTQQGTVVPSVAVYMPVDISLTQGEEIHGEAVAFLLPFHLFFSPLSWERSLEASAVSTVLPIDWLWYSKQKRMLNIRSACAMTQGQTLWDWCKLYLWCRYPKLPAVPQDTDKLGSHCLNTRNVFLWGATITPMRASTPARAGVKFAGRDLVSVSEA